MKFSFLFPPSVARWEIVRLAEELGYERVWFGDSQMLYSDCYVTMALAAANTTRIKIGTGISSPGTRVAPVTASAIASIARIAPGRAFLGLGTGHTSMRLMGQPPASTAELKEYVRVVRALLEGKSVEYSLKGRSAEIQFMNLDEDYLGLDAKIPIYIAANGPKALQTVGEVADGWIMGGSVVEDVISESLRQIGAAANAAGRELPSDFVACNNLSVCILRPGEKLTDDRVVELAGSMVTTNLHFSYEVWEKAGRPDSLIPNFFADIWDDYVDGVMKQKAQAASFRKLHEGHGTTFQAAERRFITEAAIRGSCLAGSPEEIAAQIRGLERAGVNEIALLPSANSDAQVLEDFAKSIFPHFGD